MATDNPTGIPQWQVERLRNYDRKPSPLVQRLAQNIIYGSRLPLETKTTAPTNE